MHKIQQAWLKVGKFMNNTINIKQLSLLIIISTTLAACSSAKTEPKPETLPGNWLVNTIQDKAVIANSSAQLSFHPENKLSGSASCNNISSNYSVQNNSLTIGAIATTRKMCAPALMEQESHLLQALSKVKRFQLNNGKLSLYNQQGTIQLEAKRTKPQ